MAAELLSPCSTQKPPTKCRDPQESCCSHLPPPLLLSPLTDTLIPAQQALSS